MKKIPFLNLTRHSIRLLEETSAAVRRVLERGQFILGDEVRAFETEWARYCGARGAVGVANGTDAITLALTASGAIEPGRGDEVLTTPLTAAYTALGVLNAGARPVFVDIDERSFNLDPANIEAAITPRTRAVLPVHLYGRSAAIEKINEAAARHGLIVVEDAAQAHGACRHGKSASLAATHSFYPTKNLGAFGDGGAIVSNDADFLERARILRQGGHREAFESNDIGRNSRLDELQAAILRVKLGKLDAWTARRRALAALYFEKLGALSRLTLPANDPEAVFHLFVVRHPERDRLRDFLAARGVETLVHYPYLLHEQKLFRGAGQKRLPVAEKTVGEILSLPLYPELEDDEVAAVCDAIAEFESVFARDADRR